MTDPELNILRECLGDLTMYMGSNGVNINPAPRVILNKQPQDMEQPMLNPTAHYSPVDKSIVLYTNGRHMKDILRSFAHEMIHHDQNMKGMLKMELVGDTSDPKYAQNNDHLRKLEEDAYLRGNMLFRDWSDNRKYGK